MFRSPDVAHERRSDGGFSLIEVLVALGLLMVVMTALLPQLIVGIKATGTARLLTQAKGVAQGELERMRNLPFHISPAAGDFRDVLDFYYTDLGAAPDPTCNDGGGTYALPQASWRGYVAPTEPRCAYEPPAGVPFFRTIREIPAASGRPRLTVVVDTSFLSGATPPQPVTPRAGYDTQTAAGARPAAPQIGASVTVFYPDRPTQRPVSSYTQIADQPNTTTRINAEARVAAVEVGSVTSANGAVSLSAGLLNLTGSLTYSSTSNASLNATSASLATGQQASGASVAFGAPPTSAGSAVTSGSASLATFGCEIACWDATKLDLGPMSADEGLPNAGSSSSPMQSLLTDTAGGGIAFGNGATTDYRTTALSLAPPLLRMDPAATPAASGTAAGCVSGSAGTQSYVTASGYVRTTAENYAPDPSAVESCGVARTSSISVLPTTFAPRGVVLVELRRAKVRCLVSGPSHNSSATFGYEAEVKYWNGTSYQSAGTVTETSTVDPLASINLATTSVGDGKTLDAYIGSWSMLSRNQVVTTQVDGVAEVQVPGVVTIASKPVRKHPTITDGDPDSVMSLAVGALSCSSEDAR